MGLAASLQYHDTGLIPSLAQQLKGFLAQEIHMPWGSWEKKKRKKEKERKRKEKKKKKKERKRKRKECKGSLFQHPYRNKSWGSQPLSAFAKGIGGLISDTTRTGSHLFWVLIYTLCLSRMQNTHQNISREFLNESSTWCNPHGTGYLKLVLFLRNPECGHH